MKQFNDGGNIHDSIFYIFASLAYMAIAVYSINTDSLFLGFAWGIVSIANLVEGVYLVRKRK